MRASLASQSRNAARIFAALGDETRLGLVSRLSDAGPLSIARLAEGSKVTRQAVAKHLQVMERSGLVRSRRHGRERIWQINRSHFRDAGRYLEAISRQWDAALLRLRDFVEREPLPKTPPAT